LNTNAKKRELLAFFILERSKIQKQSTPGMAPTPHPDRENRQYDEKNSTGKIAD